MLGDINKQNRNRLLDTENRLMAARGKGVWGGLMNKVKGLGSIDSWLENCHGALTGVAYLVGHHPTKERSLV